jgi:hypothetical protein
MVVSRVVLSVAQQVGTMVGPLVVAKDASTAAHWAELWADEKDVKPVVASVDSKDAMWVVLMDASMAETMVG